MMTTPREQSQLQQIRETVARHKAGARDADPHPNGPIARAVMENIHELQGVDSGEFWTARLPADARLYWAHRRNEHRTSDRREYYSACNALTWGGPIRAAISQTHQLIWEDTQP